MLPLAHGSDGGGSIRIPASCCGLFGIKPSRGRVSPAPFVSGSLELSQSGPISVTVRDAAAFLDVLAGYEPGDAHWAPPPERPFLDEVGADPGRLRIALTVEPPIPYPVDAARRRRRARRRGRARGARPRRRRARRRRGSTRRCSIVFAKLWQLTPALYPVPDESQLMPLNRALAEPRTCDVERRATRTRVGALQRLARRVVAFWDDVDVVLTPGAREAARADRLDLRAGRSVGAVPRAAASSRRSRRSST